MQYTLFVSFDQHTIDCFLQIEQIQTVVKLAERPHTPACIPHGFGTIGIPKFLENIIISVTPIPIERPVNIDLP